MGAGGDGAPPPESGKAEGTPSAGPSQRDGFGGMSLETSRAAELHREGKLPLSSGEAAAEARRGLMRWIRSLFRRGPA